MNHPDLAKDLTGTSAGRHRSPHEKCHIVDAMFPEALELFSRVEDTIEGCLKVFHVYL